MSFNNKKSDTSLGADRIDPDTYLSVELSTSHSIVQVKRKRLDLLSKQSKNNDSVSEETKKRPRSRSRSNSPK